MADDEQPFDGLLLSQVRLGIVSLLVTRGRTTFPDLKVLLGLTQGNLGSHLGKLEEGGYVAIEKAFEDRKPVTTAALTDAGRRAFLAHVARLEAIAREARPTPPPPSASR